MNAGIDPGFERLLEYVRDTRAFDYTGYRRPTLVRRFEKRMQAVGATGWAGYRRYLEQHPEEFGELFDAILINVTGFFRDKETWDVVSAEVIPSLVDARDASAPIRVWSAGCSSGEEPFTISMLFAEALGEETYKRRVKIYATDVDDEALARARDASYTAKELGDVPAELRERYFQPANGGLAFRRDLRRSVVFGRNDLHKDAPMSRVDLLVSRNTLMYFSPEIQERVLSNFHFALNQGGYLVVGKAETLQSGRRLFAPHDLKRRIFVKDGSAEPAFHVPEPAAVPLLVATAHRVLEEQLERARRDLQAAHEELQSTVEELETTNEELQSTNEELETTNEELHSTNETLEAMNEELQSTNEELEAMNDELRERTDDTLRANAFLTSVLASIQQAVIVVDSELRVIAWSSRATELLGLRDDEVEGQHLLNLDVGLPVRTLREPIRNVLGGTDDAPVVVEGHDRRGRPVRYTVGFAPLAGREPDSTAGAILLLAAEQAD